MATDHRKLDPTKPQAFLSYTRFDDQFLKGGISNLRERLEQAVQARTGKPFNIFQDVDDIRPSEDWRKKLDRAIQASQLFIPILTPSFFTSPFCRNEANAFLAYEARAGQEGLVLPIYLMDSDWLENETLRETDDIARRLHARQYDDWRSLRFELNDSETLPRIDDLAFAITSAIIRTHTSVPPPAKVPPNPEEQLSALRADIAELDQLVEAERARNKQLQIELANGEEKAEARQLVLEQKLSVFQAEIAERERHIEAERAQNQKLQAELAHRDEEQTRQLALEEKLSAYEAEATECDQLIEAERLRNQDLETELAEHQQKVMQLAEDRAVFKGRAEEAAALRQEIETLRRGQIRNRKIPQTHDRYGQSNRHEPKNATSRLLRVSGILLALLAGVGGGFLLGSHGIALEKPTTKNQQLKEPARESKGKTDTKSDDKSVTRGGIGALPQSKKDAAATSIKAPRPTETAEAIHDCDVCPHMVVIPEGSFFMGSPPSEAHSRATERPRHRVDIQSFALGRNEVTFAEWDACVAAGGCDHKPNDKGWGRGRHPVINVNWKDAQQYVNWLSRKTGKHYRLPSEAEWEYAARARSETVYPWGTKIGQNRANCKGCRGYRNEGKTEVVGSFDPNEFGLFDMHGNVWEWVEDSWHNTYDGAPDDGRAWASRSASKRTLRGGSWYNKAPFLRSAGRISDKADYRNDGFGFRVAQSLK